MKALRLGLPLLILFGFVAASTSYADENDAKCDCWYWQSNKHGVIKTTTGADGKTTESCDTSVTCSSEEMN